MAAVSATIVSIALGSVSGQSTAVQQSVATFDGLRPCPVLRRRAFLCSPIAPRRLTITAAADPKTLSTLQGIIAKHLAVGAEKVLPESKLSDLGADSLDGVQIMVAIEEEFNMCFEGGRRREGLETTMAIEEESDVSLEEEDGAEMVSTVQEAADMIYEVSTVQEAADLIYQVISSNA